jgi:adenosylmethionine-8-amino-7-oxononanoate aminotransferase
MAIPMNSLLKALPGKAKKLEHVIFAGFTHEPAITLAEKLIQVLSGDFSKIFFSDNGSTAVEVALKMGLQFWHNKGILHKKKIIAFDNAYHGDTFGAMSAGARSAFNAAFNPLLFEVHHIPVPNEIPLTQFSHNFCNLANEDEYCCIYF